MLSFHGDEGTWGVKFSRGSRDNGAFSFHGDEGTPACFENTPTNTIFECVSL